MKSLLKIFKIKGLSIVFGFIFLFLLVFIGGRRLGFPMNTRLLIIIGILFFAILFFQIKQLQAKRGAAKLEQSIKAQVDDQKLSLRPEKREEIESLKHELMSSIESLKRSKLSKGRSGQAALYALPWYMFIGPPAAGKTTAIINSGLEFPSGSDIKGVGGTRNCDWFFSNSAILLDTAGRYTTEDEDREEWHAFLDMLKKHRRRRPINGVIVGVSIADLVDAKIEDIEWHAKNIRNRINELIKRLDTRFPVYLVFTKCDLLQGFVELFENLSRKEREQIWGCTLSREQHKASNPREIFEKEFQLLVQSIYEIRLKRLSSSMKPEYRRKVYVFPIEFASIKENIGHFIGKLFQPNPYQENPFFRGFYFTSGTQEGVPIDRVIQAIARQFDLPPEMVSEPEIEKKSYFIKRLFTDVIIPDQNMVVQTSKGAVRRDFIHFGAMVASIIVLAAFILGTSLESCRSKFRLNGVKNAAKAMERVRWKTPAANASFFEPMERLREQLEKLEHRKSNPPFIHLGMYRGNKLIKPSRELYYKKLNSFVEEFLYRVLVRRLDNYSYVGEPDSWQRIYQHLKAYLLMGSEIERLKTDPSYQNFLKEELVSILYDQSKFRFKTQSEEDELGPLVELQIEFFVDSLGKEGMPAFTNDYGLIEETRNMLKIENPPGLEAVYTRIGQELERKHQFEAFTLSDAVGNQYEDILFCEYEIPGLFTKDAWERYVQEKIESTSQDPFKEKWVLDVRPEDLNQDLGDPHEIAAEMYNMYFQEYKEYWWEFLKNMEYKPFEDISSASSVFERLGDLEKSPLILLFNSVLENTKFGKESPESKKKKVTRIIDSARKKLAGKATRQRLQDSIIRYPVDEEFKHLHVFGKKTDDSPNDLSKILQQYTQIYNELDFILKDTLQEAKKYAVKTLNDNSGVFVETMRLFDQTLRNLEDSARHSLFEKPVIMAWVTVLNETQRHLNSLWQNQVYAEFKNKLAKYYPFDSKAQNDASILDVKDFFTPQTGTIWKFINGELISFVRRDTWNPKAWEGHGIHLSRNTIEAIKKAERIGKYLYERGDYIEFMLEPSLPERISGELPELDQLYINIEGREEYYVWGRPKPTIFRWPGQEGAHIARLELVMKDPNRNPEQKKYSGDFSLFRLLAETDIEPEKGTKKEFKLAWYFSRGDQYRIKLNYKLKALSEDNIFLHLKNLFNIDLKDKMD